MVFDVPRTSFTKRPSPFRRFIVRLTFLPASQSAIDNQVFGNERLKDFYHGFGINIKKRRDVFSIELSHRASVGPLASMIQ